MRSAGVNLSQNNSSPRRAAGYAAPLGDESLIPVCEHECVNRVIDYSALTYPVPKEQVAAFKAASKTAGKPWAVVSVGTIVGLVLAGIVVVFMIVTFAGTAISISVSSMSDGGDPIGFLGSIFPALFIGLIVFAAIVVVGRLLNGRNWETWYRLETFANANGMIFSPVDHNPYYPGAIFNLGDSRKSLNHLRSASDRYLDIGNYQYTTGSGKNRSTHNWGFMALHLDRRLPNMVLDSKANNGLFGGTNLPAYFDKKQILSLEGNFNDYFTLYCPREYERDALYVFTPDLMALLIDNAAPFDVEIVDDWMFVYSARPFPSADPGVYQRLFRIVDTVGAKTLAQTDRYVDENVGNFAANFVAPQGQRLKRGWSVGAVITIVAFLLIWGVPNLINVFSFFAR